MKRGPFVLLGLMLALGACASETHLPYRAWHLSFSGVPYMEVWVEDAQVIDVTGKHFHGYGIGALIDNKGGNIDPAGWTSSAGYGPGFYVRGAALPKKIYVRWQSLVEPQTYQATLDIPDSVRKLMLKEGPRNPRFKYAAPKDYYYRFLNLGLALGGWIKVWLSGTLEKAIPVMCVKAKIDPIGPYGGKSGGKYRPLTKVASDYIKHHAIPYASWNCKKH